MTKRTFLFAAVFATLLSAAFSVQAENYDYYWSGASDSNYLTTGNWNVGSPNGQQATVGLNSNGNNITAYMYNTNGDIKLYNNSLGTSVYSLNIGKEDGTGNAFLFYDHNSSYYHFTIDEGKTLSIYDGGTFKFAGAKRFVNNGTVNLNRGASFIVTEAELVIIDGANSVLNIKDGSTLTVTPTTYIGTGNDGAAVNQTGGEATFNGTLALGWGEHSGYYNLSGGTLTTTGEAGLWGANGSGISEFTVSGGTANFNKTGNSFEIGLGGSQTLANKFTLQGSGIVNVAETFAVKNSGILNIEGGTFNAPTITVDSASTFNMTGGALKTNAINMNGGTFTQGGGSLVYNGKLTVTGSAVLNGSIDMSHFLAAYNQTVDVVETTAGVSGSYTVTGDGWTTASDGNKITATYTGGSNNYYWTGSRDTTYYFAANWNVNGAAYDPEPEVNPYTGQPDKYLDLLSNPNFDKNCYILTTASGSDVSLDYSILGVASLTVGNGVGGSAGTAVLSRIGNIDVQANLIVNKGGTVSASGATTVTSHNGTPGTLTVSGGTFNANDTTTVTGNLIVSDGTYNATGATTVDSDGTLTVNGGTFNANSSTTVAGNLTVQNGVYNAKGTTTVNSGGDLTVNGGTFEFNNSSAQFQVKGDINILSGNFTITSSNAFRIGDYAKGTINVEGGTVTVKSPTYMGVGNNPNYVGTINQKAGSTVTFENVLALGWGDSVTGVYNLYGGTLNTIGDVGLWSGNASGVSTFNVEGGTANFNKSGESFTIGMGGTSTLANVFNLKSGTVNAADTFAIKYGGILNVGQSGAGDGVLNANKIEINNGGNLNMSSGTINVGEGGITSSDGAYTITLSGGTFGTNGASWSSALNAAISANTVTFAPETGKTVTWSGNFTKENNSDRGTIRKTGAGTLAFNSTSDTSANTIDANLTIDEGSVILNQSPGSGNRFAAGVVVKVNAGGKLLCNAHDSIGYGSSAVTFELNGGELAIQSSPNETLINKTVKLKGGTVSTLSNNMMDICANGNAFIVEAETGATAQNPTTSYVKGWLRLRNTTDFNITVNENAKLVVDKNFGIYDNSESTKPLVKLGSGVLVFEGNNSYTQGTKISAGTLILTENGSLGTGAVVNEASLVFAHDSEQTFTNAVSGNGTVTKTGEGRLKINAANGFQASSLIVEAGRLDFKGTLTGGGITLSENTVFSPGNSVGMAAVGGDFTLSSNSSILMEIGGSDTAQNDGLDVSGELKLNEGLIYLQMADTFNLTSGTRFYALLNGSNSGVLSDEDFIEKYVRAYGGFTELEYVQMTEGDYAGKYAITGVFDANAIPEPSTWLLLVLGTAGLLYWRKKK